MFADRTHERIESLFAAQTWIVDDPHIAASRLAVRIELVKKARQTKPQLLSVNADESLDLG
jgi:hypothetical protein